MPGTSDIEYVRPFTLALLVLAGGLTGCRLDPLRTSTPAGVTHRPLVLAHPTRTDHRPPSTPPQREAKARTKRVEYLPAVQGGTHHGRPVPHARPVTAEDQGYTLNFNGTDVKDVVRLILGELLHANYSLDPGLKGPVHLHTASPIPRSELPFVLEHLLEARGAVLLRQGDFYTILPRNKAAAPPVRRAGRTALPGYQTLVLPLEYISAAQLRTLLKPLRPRAGLVTLHDRLPLVLLTGTSAEIERYRALIRTFDIDQMRGQSIAVFHLQEVLPSTLVGELQTIFGEEGAQAPAAGMLRLVPVDRLGLLIAISPRKVYLEAVAGWIRRLDTLGQRQGEQLFVYKVRNSKAEKLAELLNGIFGTRTGGAVPPGKGAAAGRDVHLGRVKILADSENNALIIRATREDYRKILRSLDKLDTLPPQVLLQATILEVQLVGDLRYGVEWVFQHRLGSGRTGKGLLDLGDTGIAPVLPGFAYQVVGSGDAVKGVINALASDSRSKIISSPSLMVLDNHAAKIRVGDQVPVLTSQATNTGSSGSNPIITNTIEYRDAGITLDVTPHISSSGMIVLDILQEVSSVSEQTSSGINSPTINQRLIHTTIAVRDGGTVVLGGLIKDGKTRRNSGIPLLRDLPGVGMLFGSHGQGNTRVELLMTITPTVLRNQDASEAISRAFRERFGLEAPEVLR
ncbi:MAG: type II secretion system protein GspD [Gammaproteobacteria bacterium]|nr:MAG: type II secretion system protein GspD [Gammaproteobacteria bacterium]